MSQFFINQNVSGGDVISITGNSGTPATGNVTIETENTTVKFVSSASTVVQDFGLSNIVLGNSATNITSALENVGLGFNVFSALTSGDGNVSIGFNSSLSLTSGGGNTSIGLTALHLNTTSSGNTAVGNEALFTLLSGNGNNTAVGTGALDGITTGAFNIALGQNAGGTYANAESSNIVIGNLGTITENHVIRIGTQGSGNGQQNTCYIAGIVGVTVSNRQMVTINSATGQLGVASSSQAVSYTNVTHDMSPYIVLATDSYISVDCSGGAVTLNFPNTPTATQTWTVKDRTGNAAANNITLTTPGASHTFDGSPSFVMDANYSAIQLIANASNNYEVY